MSFVPSILWENICSLPAGFPRLPFPSLGGEHHCLHLTLAASPWLWTLQAGSALHPVTRRPWQSPGQAPTLPSLLPTIWPMLLGWTQVPMGRESVPGLASSGRGSCSLALGCQGLMNCCQSKHHPLPASSGPLDQEGKVEEDRGMEPRLRTRALVGTWPSFIGWGHYFLICRRGNGDSERKKALPKVTQPKKWHGQDLHPGCSLKCPSRQPFLCLGSGANLTRDEEGSSRLSISR